MFRKQRLLLNLILFFMLSGCNQNYEIYGYQKIEKNFEWGHIGSKLRGTQITDGRKTVVKSPYKLFLWFDSKTPLDKFIKIREIKLKNNKSGEIVFHDYPNLKAPFTKQDKNHTAFFLFKNIDMIHDDIELFLRIELYHEKGQPIEERASLFFKKTYQKKNEIISH